LTSRLARTTSDAPLLIVATAPLDAEVAHGLRGAGAEVLELPAATGRPEVSTLLEEFGRRRMTNVLIEGGAEVLGSFLDAGELDEAHVYIAPILVGGPAKGPFGGRGIDLVAAAMQFEQWDVRRVEGDLYWHGRRD
jgi:diaminohydroxyphosphoribosylaminopyrimidine deaminase/5-amino-6-(5-phosphoribosylamino)uracil reductase